MASPQEMINRGVGIVVGLTVLAIMVAYVLIPIGLDELASVDTENLSAGETAIIGVLGIFMILAILLVIIGWATSAFESAS